MGGDRVEGVGPRQTGDGSSGSSNPGTAKSGPPLARGLAKSAPSLVSPSASLMATRFAPAGRDSEPELHRKQELIQSASLFQAMMDAIPQMVLVLNQHRQVLVANRALRAKLGTQDLSILGQRPGELFGCIHCHHGPDGCGTAKECSTCGAIGAILTSQNLGGQTTQECRLIVSSAAGDQAMDLRVTATPVAISASSSPSWTSRISAMRNVLPY